MAAGRSCLVLTATRTQPARSWSHSMKVGGFELTTRSTSAASAICFETQEADGSWLVHKRAVSINGHVESGFPHGKFQFISYASTCWATMALSYATVDSNLLIPRL
jgi:hypothetical protein